MKLQFIFRLLKQWTLKFMENNKCYWVQNSQLVTIQSIATVIVRRVTKTVSYMHVLLVNWIMQFTFFLNLKVSLLISFEKVLLKLRLLFYSND